MNQSGLPGPHQSALIKMIGALNNLLLGARQRTTKVLFINCLSIASFNTAILRLQGFRLKV